MNLKQLEARPFVRTTKEVELMRKKELKLIITFHTTAEAMAMELACNKEGIAGRLIPVPRQISSGCGLAWSMPPECQENIKGFMEKQGLSWESCGKYII